MSRPERRRSSLHGVSPLDPPAPPSTAAVDRPATPPSSNLEQPVDVQEHSHPPASAPPKQPEAKELKKIRVGPYVFPSEAERIRSAYQFGYLQQSQGSFTDFLREALIAAVERLEADYNSGQPWPPTGRGALKSISQMAVEERKRQSQ